MLFPIDPLIHILFSPWHLNSSWIDQICRWVYEGVIDDPHAEFFIAENQSLQKVWFLSENLSALDMLHMLIS